LRSLARGLSNARVDGPRRAVRRLVLAIGLISLASCCVFAAGKADARRPQRDACPGERSSSAHVERFLKAVLCLQDAERRRHGLSSLRLESALGKAASRHTRDMVRRRYFGHVSPTGRDPRARALAAGYGGGHAISVGENLLSWTAPLTPAEMFQKWIASPPHRQDILGRRWRDVGIALVRSTPAGAGGLTVAVEFGRRS
jgi:uncharacterized protein YkwD